MSAEAPPSPQPPASPARMGNSPDDKDLVAQALAGDRAAFGVLVERYAAQARRVARAVLGDPDDADDAAQDGFLSALVKLAQYDARRPFGPWLMRIVANAATDRRRRRNVRRAEPLDTSLVGGGPRPGVVDRRERLHHRLALGDGLEAALEVGARIVRAGAEFRRCIVKLSIRWAAGLYGPAGDCRSTSGIRSAST